MRKKIKRILLLVFIALSLSPLHAALYSPDISGAIGADFTHYSSSIDPYDGYRYALSYKAKANPLAITIEENRRISLPFSFEYAQRTKAIDRYFIQERMRFSLGLEFDYIFNEHFALSIEPGVGYTYFPKINAGNLYLSLEAGPVFMINRFLSLSMPVSAMASQKGVDFEVSIGISVYPFGIMKGEER